MTKSGAPLLVITENRSDAKRPPFGFAKSTAFLPQR